MLAGLRGDRSVKEVCREHEIAETLYYTWREKLLEGGREALAGKEERTGREGAAAADRASSSGRWVARPMSLRSRGKHCEAGSERARRPVPRARRRRPRPAVVARVLQISRQAVYRVPRPAAAPDAARRPPADEVERRSSRSPRQNPTDGYRIVTAWVRRKLGRPVNRKRVLRVMRERKLIQRRTHRARAGAGPGSSGSSGPASSGTST